MVCVCSTVLLEFLNHLQEFPNLPTPMVTAESHLVDDCAGVHAGVVRRCEVDCEVGFLLSGAGQLVDDVDRVAHLAQGPVTDDPVTLPRPLNLWGRVGGACLARQSDVDGTF